MTDQRPDADLDELPEHERDELRRTPDDPALDDDFDVEADTGLPDAELDTPDRDTQSLEENP